MNKVKTNGIAPGEANGRGLLQRAMKSRARQPDDDTAVSSGCESEGARKIAQSIAYMQEHLDRPLQVATLAARVSVSPSHFFVLFKRRTGCPPIDYFIRLRMERARALLEAGSLHVKEVAAALGYEDPFYFSRMFKSVNRVAPSEYRAQSKEWKDALKNTVSSHAPPVPARLLAPGRERRRSQAPILESLERTGANRKAKALRYKNSIVHSTTANLCYNVNTNIP